jgi:DNA-binding response OmpR family regulator
MAELVDAGPEGDGMMAALLTCIDLGADSAIEKPVALDQLAVRVRVLYARHCKAQAVMDRIRASQAVGCRCHRET